MHILRLPIREPVSCTSRQIFRSFFCSGFLAGAAAGSAAKAGEARATEIKAAIIVFIASSRCGEDVTKPAGNQPGGANPARASTPPLRQRPDDAPHRLHLPVGPAGLGD